MARDERSLILMMWRITLKIRHPMAHPTSNTSPCVNIQSQGIENAWKTGKKWPPTLLLAANKHLKPKQSKFGSGESTKRISWEVEVAKGRFSVVLESYFETSSLVLFSTRKGMTSKLFLADFYFIFCFRRK